MPRNFNKYQYETSPRKLEPEYTPIKNPYKSKKTTARKTDKVKEQQSSIAEVVSANFVMNIIFSLF